MNVTMALLALAVDWFAGNQMYQRGQIGHPVQWMGRVIDWFDVNFNKDDDDPEARRRAGVIMLVGLLGVTWFITGAIAAILRDIPLGWILEGLLAAPFLASEQLGRAVRDVADKLHISIEDGRVAVGKIVGRDTAELNEAEISRAAIETLAENTSDGVIAPLFFLVLFGLPGIALYKATNTADSMVGHLSDRHRDFGRASAKLDDLVNWVPARLTALLFVGAAFVTPDASPKDAWDMARDDAPGHRSPNAGWPEAAMAGALDLGLGGPRTYRGEETDLPAMGRGRRNLAAEDIYEALVLYRYTIWLTLGLVGLAAVLANLF